jgi:hypothetical protein
MRGNSTAPSNLGASSPSGNARGRMSEGESFSPALAKQQCPRHQGNRLKYHQMSHYHREPIKSPSVTQRQRIPSVSSLEETRPSSSDHTEKSKNPHRAKQIQHGRRERGRIRNSGNGSETRRAPTGARRVSLKWTLGRDGICFRPATCPETSGQNTKKKNVLSISKENHPRENTKKQETFFFLVLPSEARRWRGVRRAYEKLSHHTARGACTLPMLLFISQILKIGSNLVQ